MAVLASGGVDSACLLDWAEKHAKGKVYPVYVRFGMRWERSEIQALRKFLNAIRRKKIKKPAVLLMPSQDLYSEHWGMTGRRVPGPRSADDAVYLPGRNLLLLSKALVFSAQREIDAVCIGTLSANPFADASAQFFSAFQRLAKNAIGEKIRILAPFRHITKNRLIRRYARLPLHLCFSCLNPGSRGRACGRCNKCVEWKRAQKNP